MKAPRTEAQFFDLPIDDGKGRDVPEDLDFVTDRSAVISANRDGFHWTLGKKIGGEFVRRKHSSALLDFLRK